MESLSILIPIYDWDSTQLIKDLHFQGLVLGIPYEIIVADDCSTDKELQEKNRIIAESHENCRYYALQQNIGRAAIRNYMADRSQYQKLLFMDCDGQVNHNKDFLKNYMDASSKADVICGGVAHSETNTEPGSELRYAYEKNADLNRSARVRNLTPSARFLSTAFLIDRDAFMQIRFDESYIKYGYEDVQFGYELEKHNISILHIDNPVIQLGLDTNEVFLEKSRQAVVNAFEHREGLGDSSTLLNHYNRVRKLCSRWIFRILWAFWGKKMESNLLSADPSLKVFSLYKLCYICSLR